MSWKPDPAEILAAERANDIGFRAASDKPRTFSFSPQALREFERLEREQTRTGKPEESGQNQQRKDF